MTSREQLQQQIKEFIEPSKTSKIDELLDSFECTTDEDRLLVTYLRTTSHRDEDSSRMYLFIMMCFFFHARLDIGIPRWNAFVTSAGFHRLVSSHLNFELDGDKLVDECFKLWIIEPGVVSRATHA